MPNELREHLIAIFVRRGHRGKEIVEEVKEILALIAPELEKAEKWDKVVEIASSACTLQACPLFKRCNDLPCLAQMIVDALEKEST